jgi:two-component system, NtrC family, sensor kinase
MNNENQSEKRILLVDDTKENIDVLAEVLSQYKRSVALNGERALKIALEKKPDLILLDIMMPEMDGFEVCRRLKADESTKDIPVIFITAKNQVEDEVQGLEVGAVDFITKPISPPIVLARVKSHLELKEARQRLTIKNEELSKTLQDLRDMQNQLIHSEKMAALGQLVAGIAHEINTPLGAINSSNKIILEDIDFITDELHRIYSSLTEKMKILISLLLEYVAKKPGNLTSKDERKFRRNVTEQLISHQINNADDLADIFTDIGVFEIPESILLLTNEPGFTEVLQAVHKLASIKSGSSIISTAIEKVSKIIFSLKNFSRFDSEGRKEPCNINENIETVLTLYNNQFKQGIEIIRIFNIDRPVPIVQDQIGQVWTNIIHNSIHAMNGRGVLTIRTDVVDSEAVISFKDTGKGIPPEIMDKIFNPFFTTKPPGEGTGLGLDIVNKIIKGHNGRIEVNSEPDNGAEFKIILPMTL